jgi:hypothetical protein
MKEFTADCVARPQIVSAWVSQPGGYPDCRHSPTAFTALKPHTTDPHPPSTPTPPDGHNKYARVP